MNQRVFEFKVLAAVLAALTLTGPATAGESVPFKGKSSGIITTVGFDPVAGIVETHEVAEGEATYFGHFKMTGDAKIHLPSGIVTGTLTITAANGDMLFLTMAAYGVDPTHGIGTVTIAGGTGRFQGATGSFQRMTTFVFPPGPAFPPPAVSNSDEFDGIISFGPK